MRASPQLNRKRFPQVNWKLLRQVNPQLFPRDRGYFQRRSGDLLRSFYVDFNESILLKKLVF